jgi:hypothetical protein
MFKIFLFTLCSLVSVRATESTLPESPKEFDVLVSRTNVSDIRNFCLRLIYSRNIDLLYRFKGLLSRMLPDPFSDIGLRPLGMPTPQGRIFQFKLGENTVILVGTLHTVPLFCYMPYNVAENLVKRTCFLIDEINGDPLGEGRLERSLSDAINSFRLNEGYAEGDFILSFKQWADGIYTDLGRLSEAADKKLNEYFDESGKWYPKAGITPDILKDVERESRGFINAVGPELHPAFWEFMFKASGFMGPNTYTPNPLGGIDDHLGSLGQRWHKRVFALETGITRTVAEISELSKKLSGKKGSDVYRSFYLSSDNVNETITKVKKGNNTEPKHYDDKPVSILNSVPFLFEDYHTPKRLRLEDSEELRLRNQEWVERIREHIYPMSLPKDQHILMYVGQAHIDDLLRHMCSGRMISGLKELTESDLYKRFG